jgi:hypothetical protein
MPERGPPLGTPLLGRFALMLAVAVLGAAACSGESATPTASPADAPAPTSAADPPVQATTATEPVPDTGTKPGLPRDIPDRPAQSAEPPGGSQPAGDSDPNAADQPAGLSPDAEAQLAALLDDLSRLAREWDPAARASLAVVTPDGTLHGFNEHRGHISASAVKPIWTAAAIDLAGVAAVTPLAAAALVHSDNFAAGQIIDLIGVDAVNNWGTDVVGTTGTHLAAWYFGTDRVAQSVIDGGSRANLTTVGDLALFYAGLRRGDLLDPDGAAALEGWLRATDRGSTAAGAVRGALLARLPSEVATAAIHKAGWLPPYCCRAEVRLVLDAGVIPLPGGSWFAIGAVSDRGDFYNLSVRWVSLAACRVYALLADDPSHGCARDGDGVPRPDLWTAPPEPEPESEAGPDEPEAGPDGTARRTDAGEVDDQEPPEDELPPRITEAEPLEVEPGTEPDSEPTTDPAEASDGSGGSDATGDEVGG